MQYGRGRFGRSGFRRPVRALAGSVAAVLAAGLLLAVNLPSVASAASAPAPSDATTRPWQTLQSVDGVLPPRSPAPVVSSWPVAGDGEVAALRTRMSRTFTHGDGNYQTVSSPVPVNFRDGQGRWTPIDDSLVRQPSGVFGVAADSYGLVVPVTAAEPVVASQGSMSVSTALQGASATSVVSVAGSTATYRSVLPGVDLLVSARPGSVDQTLRLASAAAPSTFTYAVTVPAGDVLRAEPDRSVSIVDGSGSVAGSLPAPVMGDSSGDVDHETSSNVQYEVSGTGPVFTVRVVADAAWLADPARVFPVLVDPSTTFGTSSDLGCYVSSPGASDGSLCAANSGTDNSLNYGHTAYTRHLLIKFGDLTAATSAVPADAVISDAALTLTAQSTSGSVALDTGVYRVGAPFTTAITWANQPPVGSGVQDHVSVTPPAVGATATFHVGNLVSSWITGGSPNYGLEIKQTDDSVPASTIAFYGLANAAHPTLTVTWQPVVGQQKWVGAYDHTLSDRLDLHVDLADRNLVVNALDENLSAPGQSLLIRRTYNSRVAAATTGAFGVGWLMSGGTDVSLAINRDVVTFTQPGGAQVPIYRAFGHDDLTQPDAFIIPPGLNADFTMPDATHYKLKFHTSKVVDTFTLPSAGASTAWLSSVADADGNTTTFTATGSPLVTTKATDTTGQRSVAFTYTSGRVTGMTETLAAGAPGARSWSYGYDGTGHLTSSTDPAGKTARYCYSGALLTKIITPRGAAGGATCTNSINAQTTDISYDAAGAVNTITYESTGATPVVLTFTAQSTLAIASSTATAVTRFTDPYGKNTDYTYDTTDRVTKAVDPLGDTVSSTFTTNNDVNTAVSANNNTGGASDPSTTNSYDANNNKTSVTLPTGSSVAATYAGTQAYQPDTSTDDLGNASSHTYNAAGHLTATTKGGVKVAKVYEGDGGVHCGPGGAAAFGGALCEARDADYSATLPAEHRTAYTYNALGQLVTVTPATPDHGRSTPPATTVTYDSHSRPQTVTDGLGRSVPRHSACPPPAVLQTVAGGTAHFPVLTMEPLD